MVVSNLQALIRTIPFMVPTWKIRSYWSGKNHWIKKSEAEIIHSLSGTFRVLVFDPLPSKTKYEELVDSVFYQIDNDTLYLIGMGLPDRIGMELHDTVRVKRGYDKVRLLNWNFKEFGSIVSDTTISYLSTSIGRFYGFFMIIIGYLFGFILYRIFLKEEKEKNENINQIEGILYLSLAFFMWAISGTISLMSFVDEYFIILSGSVLSTINSVLILFAIPSIYLKDKKYPWIKSISVWLESKGNKIVVCLAAFFFIALSVILTLSDKELHEGFKLYYLPDVFFSSITIFVMLTVFLKAFWEREMKFIWFVSICMIFLTIIAQLQLFPNEVTIHNLITKTVASTTFKTLLAGLFFIFVIQLEIQRFAK